LSNLSNKITYLYKFSRLVLSCSLLISLTGSGWRLQGFDLAPVRQISNRLIFQNPASLLRLKLAVRKSPGDFELWLDLAGLFLPNHLQKARRYLTVARRKGAAGLRYEHLYGQLLMGEGDYEEATRHLFQALVLSDQEEPFYFETFAENALLGKTYIKGLRWTTLGLKLHSAQPRLLTLYGYLFIGLGRYQEAEVALIRARKLNPADPQIPFNLACIYAYFNDKDACLFHLRKAVIKGYSKTYHLRLDPVFGFLRDHPQFQLVLKQARQNESRSRPKFNYRVGNLVRD
jgi:tetratricopeptide (TPR) repeat protein